MLKRVNRLKARGEFKRTLAGRRICINECFVVYGLMLPDLSALTDAVPSRPEPRIGFVVSKKVHKRATRRNTIKRRLRELVRTWLLTENRHLLARYRSLVFIARGGSLDASYATLSRHMERCFRPPSSSEKRC